MTRPRRKARPGQLTDEQLAELCSRMGFFIGNPSTFESDSHRRAAWFEHRDRVLAHYQSRYARGRKSEMPAAWYAYEAPPGERRPYGEPARRR